MRYSDDRWSWYASAYPENGYPIGPCLTRGVAIELALATAIYEEIEPGDGQSEWTVAIEVTEGVRPEVGDMKIDGDDILENLDGFYSEWSCEESLFAGVTKEQTDDLTRHLTAALHAWARENAIQFRRWSFADTRNDERVVLPHPVPADAPS